MAAHGLLVCSWCWLMLLIPLGYAVAADIPNCPFSDTVKLRTRNAQGQFVHDGVVVWENLTGTYDYFEHAGGERQPVAEHTRGCVCQLKPCIKLCCHPKKFVYSDDFECAQQEEDEIQYNPYVNVTDSDGNTKRVHVLDEFVYQVGQPCRYPYLLPPHDNGTKSWQLFQNGTLLRLMDGASFTRDQYCFKPSNNSMEDGDYLLNPVNCGVEYEPKLNERLNKIAMTISVFFLTATVIVYVAIRELRNLHGKCLICYLSTLASGYALLVYFVGDNVNAEICPYLGFLAYFCFMSAFFWVNVISFDLWHNFRTTKSSMGGGRRTKRKRFLWYSLYAWSSALFLTVVVIYCQVYANIDERHRPGIGVYSCYLKPYDWSSAYYFYSMLLLLMIINVIFFAHTSVKIHRVQKEFNQFSRTDGSARHLQAQSDNFWLYLRLLMVMGITWMLEVFSYVADNYEPFILLTYVVDFSNAIQGIVIFILFVCKRKVIYLIKKRIYHNKGDVTSRSSSSRCKTSMLTSTRNLSNVPSLAVTQT